MMRTARHRRDNIIWLLLALLLMLPGCGGASGPTPSVPPREHTDPNQQYQAPPFADAAFHESAAEGSDTVQIDLSATASGYIAVAAESEKRLKFQAIKDDMTYTYNLSSQREPSIFPLQCGNGTYRFRVMENVSDNKYAEVYSVECDVVLDDEFQPYLRPSDYVDYSRGSACVAKAAELAGGAGTALDVVAAVYDFVCKTVRYDMEKAQTVQSGYLPVPDETMSTGRGICFDYASLAAAMLRSQGIPTKLIMGYVSPDGLYHAWNMFYTEETGWVAVEFKVSGPAWIRLDLTFSAGGTDESFIGNGENYSDLYQY
jgi:transglutaminase-like putative cysteine protease